VTRIICLGRFTLGDDSVDRAETCEYCPWIQKKKNFDNELRLVGCRFLTSDRCVQGGPYEDIPLTEHGDVLAVPKKNKAGMLVYKV
jgi:hypothetical protein